MLKQAAVERCTGVASGKIPSPALPTRWQGCWPTCSTPCSSFKPARHPLRQVAVHVFLWVWARRCAGSSAAADALCLCLIACLLASGQALAPHGLPTSPPANQDPAHEQGRLLPILSVSYCTLQSLEDTLFTLVDTPESLCTMVQKLQGAAEIAVDLEHHSYR